MPNPGVGGVELSWPTEKLLLLLKLRTGAQRTDDTRARKEKAFEIEKYMIGAGLQTCSTTGAEN